MMDHKLRAAKVLVMQWGVLHDKNNKRQPCCHQETNRRLLISSLLSTCCSIPDTCNAGASQFDDLKVTGVEHQSRLVTHLNHRVRQQDKPED